MCVCVCVCVCVNWNPVGRERRGVEGNERGERGARRQQRGTVFWFGSVATDSIYRNTQSGSVVGTLKEFVNRDRRILQNL